MKDNSKNATMGRILKARAKQKPKMNVVSNAKNKAHAENITIATELADELMDGKKNPYAGVQFKQRNKITLPHVSIQDKEFKL